MEKQAGEKLTSITYNGSKNSMTTPHAVSATSGDSNGEIDLAWEPVRGAKAYIVQRSIKSSEPGRWIQEDIITKSGRYTVSKLKSGQKYWFRCGCAGLASGHGANLFRKSAFNKVFLFINNN
jgi:hypothetical protein